MSKPYNVIKDYYPSTMYADKIAEVPDAVKQLTPGWRIMNQGQQPTTAEALFKKFVQWLGGNCKWIGLDPRGTGYKLLDGDETTGQCALFATAFQLLLISPPPFGLALTANVEKWNGRYKKGFVVSHPRQFMKLSANVQNKPIRFWVNHKLVRHQQRLFDPCYGNANATEADIMYHVTNEVKKGNATWHEAETSPRAAGIRVDDQPLKDRQRVFFKEQNKVYTGPFLSIS